MFQSAIGRTNSPLFVVGTDECGKILETGRFYFNIPILRVFYNCAISSRVYLPWMPYCLNVPQKSNIVVHTSM